MVFTMQKLSQHKFFKLFLICCFLGILLPSSFAYAGMVRRCWMRPTPWGWTRVCRTRYIPNWGPWRPGPWYWNRRWYPQVQCRRICLNRSICFTECNN